jgi:hypothetical protein
VEKQEHQKAIRQRGEVNESSEEKLKLCKISTQCGWTFYAVAVAIRGCPVRVLATVALAAEKLGVTSSCIR